MSSWNIEGMICRTELEVKCEICHRDMGRTTRIIGDNWVTCDDCKREKEEAEREIRETEEKIVELDLQFKERYPHKCSNCGEEFDDTHSRCVCIHCEKGTVLQEEGAYSGDLWNEWSSLRDRFSDLKKAFDKKFYHF